MTEADALAALYAHLMAAVALSAGLPGGRRTGRLIREAGWVAQGLADAGDTRANWWGRAADLQRRFEEHDPHGWYNNI